MPPPSESDSLLLGARVLLSPLEDSDLDQIHLWKNDALLARAILARPMPVSREEVANWQRTNQADKNQVLLGIRLAEEGDLIGLGRLMFVDWLSRTCELGIWIGAGNQRGRGLGREAVSLLVEYAFQGLNLRRVHLRVGASNTAAIACYLAVGFEREGVLREHVWNDGKYEDVVLMGILRREGRL